MIWVIIALLISVTVFVIEYKFSCSCLKWCHHLGPAFFSFSMVMLVSMIIMAGIGVHSSSERVWDQTYVQSVGHVEGVSNQAFYDPVKKIYVKIDEFKFQEIVCKTDGQVGLVQVEITKWKSSPSNIWWTFFDFREEGIWYKKVIHQPLPPTTLIEGGK